MAARKRVKLGTYREKRTPGRTPEPFGGGGATGAGLFVVQHHAARAMHYDLRLELGGVLKSWAVPKGPSANPADKRLAIAVEDHPVEYAAFEGVIPEGNYGAGAVIVWDRGSWSPAEDPEAGLEKGKLQFRLNGYKLRGLWALVKTRRSEKDWLLIKERDPYVDEKGTEAYAPDSIFSGLTVEQLRDDYTPSKKIITRLKRLKARKKTVDASRVEMMLAQPGEPFSAAGWLFEIKYDGYRLWIAKQDSQVTLYSRNGNDLTATFPEIAETASKLPLNTFVIDGEAVVHGPDGLPSFALLQKRGRLKRSADIRRIAVKYPASFYAFDLIGFDQYDLRDLPLEKRKAVLHDLLPSVGPIRFSEHIARSGENMYDSVRELGLEGLVAKRADSAYRKGRSSEWIKIRVDETDDFAVIGYTDAKGSQTGFGALLLGQYVQGELVYFGRVGTGFGQQEMTDMAALLAKAKAGQAPEHAAEISAAHWVRPELVVEVRFKEITPDGMLRHPVFLRVRDDKEAEDCIAQNKARELPEPKLEESEDRPAELNLTNQDKVFWPEDRYTKGDLIEYYRRISEWLLPYLKDRPLVMTRYPDGIEGKHFFQKDAPSFAPDWIRRETLWSEQAEREVRYFVADDLESLLYIINMGTIPIHLWASRFATLEKPDWCVLDLDPKDAAFKDVIRIAKTIHELCDAIGLPSFLKTSGSTGLHVLIPLGARHTYEQSRNLAKLIATVVCKELPDIATTVRSPRQREGKVYVDYVQNGHGRLLAAPFCVRPLPKAPVSMPLKWTELSARLSNTRYRIDNAIRRMAALKTDPMADVLKLRPDLSLALEKLGKTLTKR